MEDLIMKILDLKQKYQIFLRLVCLLQAISFSRTFLDEQNLFALMKMLYIQFQIQLVVQNQLFMNQREACPKCERRYTQGNPAKKLINCNHTICFQCLNQEIICPIDRKRIEKRKYTIEAFHNNVQIMNNILNLIPQTHTAQLPNTLSQQQMPNKHLSNNPKIIAISNSSHSSNNSAKSKSKCSSKSPKNEHSVSIKESKTNEISTFKTPPKTSTPRMSNDPIQFEICLLHSKNADLICTQDQSFICSSCALFGEHKQHSVISYDSFVSKISKITDSCLNDYEHLKEKQMEVTEEQMKEFMEELMKERRTEIVKNLQSNFKRMRETINKLQKEIITNLDVIINFKKQKISKTISFDDINKKALEFYRKVENLGLITEDVFRLKNIDKALKFIDEKSQQSYLCKEGEYLMLEIDSSQQLIKKNIQKEALDFNYQWNSSMQQTFIEGITTFQSNDLFPISQLLQQKRQKSKPLNYMLKGPPKAVTPTVQKNKQEQILLINTDSKSNSQDSPQQNQKKKNISPIQPVQKFQYPAEIKYVSSCRNLNKQNEDHPFIKMSDIPLSNSISVHHNSNSMHRKTSSSFNRTINMAPSIKKRMAEEQDKKHQLSISRQNKSKPKSNNNSSHTTERQLLNVLNQKSENKRRKKIDMPEKFIKIWEDLQRDKLDIVDFGGAFLGDSNMLIVSEFFQKSNKLKSIKLMNNHISDQIFPQLIQRCLKAHSLNLSYNNLTQKCLDFLERQAQYLGDLRNITLSKNKIVLRNVKDRLEDLKKRGINVSL